MDNCKLDLTSPQVLKGLLQKYHFNFSKSLGQNYLIDRNIVDRIIEGAGVAGGLVVEIGPGFGVLTQELVSKADKVIAIEKDKKIPAILSEIVPDKNLEIVCADVLKTDVVALIREAGYEDAIVVANLPYYITTPIMMMLLEEVPEVKQIIVMMQREVADRVQGVGDRGALTVSAAYYCETQRIVNVSRNSFMPSPNVDSAVIKMTRIAPRLKKEEETMLFRLIKAIFAQRRKTLVNAISSANIVSKNVANDVIMSCGFPHNVRGEILDIDQLCGIASKLLNWGNDEKARL